VIFVRRDGRKGDPLLHRKVQLFASAAVLALVGIALEASWLVGAAILLLLAAFVMTFLSKKAERAEPPAGEGDDEPGDKDPNAV